MFLCVSILISFVSWPLITRAAGNSCESDQWQCRDGSCTLLDKVCDGSSDCSDNSDETLPFCSRLPSGKSCVLPPYPQHGTYDVEDLPDARPGQSRVSFVLTVRCRRGYGVMDLNGDGSGTQKVYCVNGKWHREMPKCVRFCKLDPDPSVRYMCYVPGRGMDVCQTYIQPGTSVEPICNGPIYYSNELLPNMRCLSGVWNYVALCKAECGRVTPVGGQLAIGGTHAKRGELPWHVGIYRKTTSAFMQICGGSLISTNIVISAAHCFWRDLVKLLPASEFGVAGGKIYRPWDSEDDVNAQRSGVKEIKIPSLFDGEAANFQEDIAVLTLTTAFNFTRYLRPVCLDFGANFDRLQLQHGKLGKVAGWGLTAVNGMASQTLRVVEMPFISVETCLSTLPASFREYITGDKFCAGYTNGTALCQGDSGGGLAFSERERGVDRYYLRGVVSAAPNDENKLCNDNVYTTFTRITKHQEFLKEAFAASAKKTCPLYSFQCADGSCVDPGADCNGRQDCADGSDESDELCRIGTFTATILFPKPLQLEHTKPVSKNQTLSQDPALKETGCEGGGNHPWPVAIYNTTRDGLYFICGGILISHRHVITVAHHMYKYREMMLVNQISVKLGLVHTNNLTETAVTRTVLFISVIDTYTASSVKDDISILTLNEKVNFNGYYINAACLWKEDSVSSASFGVYSGWHHTGRQELHRMIPVNTVICQAHSRENVGGTVCVETLNSFDIDLRSSGSGFYLSDRKKWRLRGLLSLVLKCPASAQTNTCISGKYLVFTDIGQHLTWIKKILSEY